MEGNTRVSDAGVDFLANITNGKLEGIKLSDCSVTRIPNIVGLQVLDLFFCPINSYDRIKSLTEMMELNLDGRGVHDSDIMGLGALKSLVKLDLHSAVISDRGAREICKLSNLKWLAVCGGSLTSVGARMICDGCEMLRRVDFSQNSCVRDEAVGALAALVWLEEINLSNTGVTSATLYLWAVTPNLKCLTLLGCKGITEGRGGDFGVRAWTKDAKNYFLDRDDDDSEEEDEDEVDEVDEVVDDDGDDDVDDDDDDEEVVLEEVVLEEEEVGVGVVAMEEQDEDDDMEDD